MAQLGIGDSAPAFTLLDHDNNKTSLSDFHGRKVIVYFYPAAMTPGCTIQAVDFSTWHDDFRAAGIHVIGISPDSPQRLSEFSNEYDLNLHLLADPDHETIEAYGAWGTKQIFGKPVTGVLRSTFLISVNEQGTGIIELAQYNVRAKGHVARLRNELGIGQD